MTEIITPFEIYIICQADAIIELLRGIGILGSILSAFAFVICCTINDDDKTKRIKPKHFKMIVCIFIITTITGSTSAFIPSTKTLAVMKVIPAIVNNKDIQKECKEIYNIAKQGLKETVKE